MDNREGCWCGYQTSLPSTYKVVGNGSTLADRQAGADMLTEWNRYATMFTVQVDAGNGLGGNNGTNELNVFITSTDSLAVYGFTMTGSLYGQAVMWPEANFGSFNDCQYFSASGCGPFTETDVVVNAGFSSGWISDWFADGGSPALVQTTALHEVGHTLGLHHVFTLPAFGDSFSTMNYINDDAGKFVTRMDAKTLRAEYATRANALTDMAIYPFVFGNSQYGETYASTSATSLNAGDAFTLNNFRISNVGNQTAAAVVVSFYLIPAGSRQYPVPTDLLIGTASYGSVAADAEGDQASTPLSVPGYVPSGSYNLGAIVTVNGAEDSAFVAGKSNNNRFIVGHGTRDVLTVLNDPANGRGWVLSSYSSCVGGSFYPYTNNTGGAGQFVQANSDCLGGAMDTILYSPSFSLANAAYVSAQVQFKSDFHDYLNRDQGWVDVSSDGGATWIERMYFNHQDYRGPITQTINLTPYLGSSAVKLRFEYEAPGNDWYWQVDDVVVTAVQQGACSSHACTPSQGRKSGDCNGDGTVSLAELQQVASNQLGITSTGCGDCDGSGQISITELQKTVNCQLGLPSCDATCQH